jgi:hypothetical protein
MKRIFITSILLLSILSSRAQQAEEILSFEYKVVYADPAWKTDKWYLINAIIKYDDGSILQKQDSIHHTGADLSKVLQIKYSVSSEDYYIANTFINYEGVKKYERDSMLLYIPLEQNADTLNTLLFSEELKKMSEPKLYNSNNRTPCIRITIVFDDYSEMFRLVKNNRDVSLTYKKLVYGNNAEILKNDTTFLISGRKRIKCINSIFERKLLKSAKQNFMLPHDILIESNSNDGYGYTKINSYRLKLYNKDVYESIKQIRKMIPTLNN